MEYRKEHKEEISQSKTEHVSAKFGVSPAVAQLLIARGFADDNKIESFLNPNEKQFHDPFLLKGMKEAVERIEEAIKNKERINVFGDYDVDGITATVVLVNYLESRGLEVSHFLPNRYVDGYGLTKEAIDKIITEFKPSLLISVDCGISCCDEVEYLKSKRVDVIITDHHDIPEKIPNCTTLDAKLSGQAYPFCELCGAGVVFKLVQALAGLECAKRYLPIVALATVSDIVPLLDENRAIVALGLKDSEHTMPLGIKLLASSLKLKGDLTATDISFKIAPKINASGRMGDAEHSYKLFTLKTKQELLKIIEVMQDYNTERQNLCNMVYADCIKELSTQNLANMKAIVMAGESWNIGILGIVAARIAEEYNRPTFLFGRDGDEYRGSCRSINNMNIHDILTQLKDTLESFGGHMMAAGLTIKAKNFPAFASDVNRLMAQTYPDSAFIPFINYDLDIEVNKITPEFIEAFDRLEPFGFGNPKPLFRTVFDKCTVSTMKNYPQHLSITLPNINILGFSMSNYFNLISQASKKQALMELQVNYYRGEAAAKGILRDIKLDAIPFVTSERIGGEYIKQLAHSNNGKTPKYDYYNRDELEKIVNIERRNSLYGTLFLANTIQSYREFVERNPFVKNIIYFEFLYFTNNNGYNTLCLCPSLDNCYKNFNRIVLLDSVLDEAYIIKLNELSAAQILIPQSSPFVYAPFKNIDLSRKIFGEYFNLLKVASKVNLTALDEFNYFNKLKKNSKNINYVQFVACLYTFAELGFIKINPEYGNFGIKILSGAKSSLEHSRFYTKLELIMKTY